MPSLNLEQLEKKKELAKHLRFAAELEHQFTCMYLYAAFSLKKHADGPSFNNAHVEVTRRWASIIYMVARQEMEHLAIVNQLLAAIGEPPCYNRRNFPYYHEYFRSHDPTLDMVAAPALTKKKKSISKRISELCGYLSEFLPDITPEVQGELNRYLDGALEAAEKIDEAIRDQNGLTPCNLPFLFTQFDLYASRRYTVMESPYLSNLILTGQLGIAKDIKEWAYKQKGGKCLCVLPSYWQDPPENKHTDNVHIGDIEMYYEEIKNGFVELGEDVFVPTYAERQVKILSQYDIYMFPINDLASAKNGIELIIKQGEAVGSSPGYDSHFRHFYDIAKEYETLLGFTGGCGGTVSYKNYKPFFNVLPNPVRDDIKIAFVQEIFDLFNFGYRTMLYCLNGLYGWYSEREEFPFLSNALRDIIFAPTMTLFIRAIGEVLVLLPSGTRNKETGEMFRAAPNFDVEDKYNLVEKAHCLMLREETPLSLEIDGKANGGDWQHAEEYKDYRRLSFYTERFDRVVDKLEKLSKDDRLDKIKFDGENPKAKANQAAHIRKCLVFAHQNMFRMNANLAKTYKDNIYQKFKSI